jgi:hypothetical protein
MTAEVLPYSSLAEFCGRCVLPLTVTDLRPDDESRCSVCLEAMDAATSPKDIFVLTPCKHFFHAVCISEWMHSTSAQRGTCPNCRLALFVPDRLEIAQRPGPRPQAIITPGINDQLAEMQTRITELAEALENVDMPEGFEGAFGTVAEAQRHLCRAFNVLIGQYDTPA